jgi:hypothetical protein
MRTEPRLMKFCTMYYSPDLLVREGDQAHGSDSFLRLFVFREGLFLLPRNNYKFDDIKQQP